MQANFSVTSVLWFCSSLFSCLLFSCFHSHVFFSVCHVIPSPSCDLVMCFPCLIFHVSCLVSCVMFSSVHRVQVFLVSPFCMNSPHSIVGLSCIDVLNCCQWVQSSQVRSGSRLFPCVSYVLIQVYFSHCLFLLYQQTARGFGFQLTFSGING